MRTNQRPVILVFIRHYLPGYRSGGPVRSISNLVGELSDEYSFFIVCLDRDHSQNIVYPNLKPGKWLQLGGAFIYYANDNEVGFTLCRKILHDIKPDMIYLNSMMDKDFSIKPFLEAGRGREIPVLLAPRGELSSGALSFKAMRKSIFISLVKASRYYRKIYWHASSEDEAACIREVINPDEIRIFHAQNLPERKKQNITKASIKRQGVLKIVMAARISPMKNTLAAIRIVGKIKGEVELDLWGPLENKGYWKTCQQQAILCPPNIKIRFRGEVAYEKLQVLLHDYDVMLLPTLGENFGHSIIEALIAGLPVIISDKTPWRRLMDSGVGADIPLKNEFEFVRQLERFRMMNEIEMQDVRTACVNYVSDWYKNHANLDDYRKMFDFVIAS